MKKDLANKSAIVVGAGPGGLTAAMLLASRGCKVTVLEKAKSIGGRNAALKAGDFTFDTGPTFLLMKYVLDQVFSECGRKSEDYLDFAPLEPMYRLNFSDRSIDIFSDAEKMQEQVDRYFPGNEGSVAKFYDREQRRFDALMPVLQEPFASIKDFLTRRFLKAMPWLYNGRSLYTELGRYYKDEQLRLCFTFQSKYLGMSPWDCPSAFTLIPFAEHRFGIHHVMGGLCQISLAMAKVVEEEGGEVVVNSTVEKLIVEDRQVKGVILQGGQKKMADVVIVNADAAWALSNLLPEDVKVSLSPEKIRRRRFSCSTFMLYLGLDKVYDLPHHNIYFAHDYRRNVADVFAGRVDPKDVSFYLQNAAATDGSLAPKGKSTFYVLAPVANLKANYRWTGVNKQKWRRELLRQVADRAGIPNIEKHIEKEVIISPADWESDYNVFLGAVFGFSHHLNQMLLFRTHNRFEEIPGLYFVGASTHPGSGLPTIYESARIAVRQAADALIEL